MMPAGSLRAADMAGLAGWLCAALAMCALPPLAQADTVPHAPFTVLALGMAALNALSIAWRGWACRALRSSRQWTVPIDTAIGRIFFDCTCGSTVGGVSATIVS